MMAPMASNLSTSLQRQSDLQLVEDGAPAFLLLLDGLAESSPGNPDILLAASRARIAYAAAFLDKTEAERARMMYAKARDYGLAVLVRNKRFKAVADQPVDVFKTALLSFGKKDVPALYTASTAWTGWIVNSPDSVDALSQWPKAMALMQRVLELEPSYQSGGPDMFFGVYCAVQPRGAGRDLEKSKAHFEKSMACAGPDYLLPKVAFAEFYARYAFDRDLFERTLQEVVSHKTDAPDSQLMNAAARKRAQSLLERVDDLF